MSTVSPMDVSNPKKPPASMDESEHILNEANDDGILKTIRENAVWHIEDAKLQSFLKLIEKENYSMESIQKNTAQSYKIIKLLNNKDIKDIHEKDLIFDLTYKNTCLFLEIANIFSLESSKSKAFDNCLVLFGLLVEHNMHLDLSFSMMKKLCLNSSINTSSELEVLHAIDVWINHDSQLRSRFGFDLLKTVRLHLISDAALSKLLDKKDSIVNFHNINQYTNSVWSYKNQACKAPYRYCSLKTFDFLVGCHTNTLNKFATRAVRVGAGHRTNKLEASNIIAKSSKILGDCNVIYSNGYLYYLSGRVFQSFSIIQNKWVKSVRFKNAFKRDLYYPCSLNGKVYILRENYSSVYNPKTKDFETIKNIRERRFASCSVFRGKIAITGGLSHPSGVFTQDAADEYDPSSNKWSSMPFMLEERHKHSSVSVRNRLYIVGGTFHAGGGPARSELEVFDTVSNKFNYLKKSLDDTFLTLHPWAYRNRKSVAIGNIIYIFVQDSFEGDYVIEYNFETEKLSKVLWSHQTMFTKSINAYAINALPSCGKFLSW